LAPGGSDLVVLIRSYFDESFDDAGTTMCIAGFIFRSDKARELTHAWKAMLRRYDLPYFRMSACNSGHEPFNRLSEDECIAAQKEAIGLVGKYAAFGAAITLDIEA